jgi:hypothetical protein
MEPSLSAQADALLGNLNFLYGVASGFLLKYAFDWSGKRNRAEFAANRVGMALLMALGALVLAAVLVTLMWDVATAALGADGPVDPTLAIFVFTWLVMIVLALVSVFAVFRASADLWHFRSHLRPKWLERS